jgi:predicted RNA-binding protein with PUA-like domain
MHYWLMKSEPGAFSIDDLARKGSEPWDGVRNYQARNFMRDGMRVGDGVLFYHSNCAVPGVAGVAEVASAAYPDPSQFRPRDPHFDPDSPRDAPRWWLVDVRFVRKLAHVIALDTLRADAGLGDFALTRRGNRLSVLPVSAAQWRTILSHEKDSA